MLGSHHDKIGVGARFHEEERAAGTVRNSTSGVAETFTGASSQPEYERWRKRTQAFLPVKEAGLYVDLDNDGKLGSEPPVAVGKNTAAACIDYARSEVQRLYAAKIVRNLLPPLPKPKQVSTSVDPR